MSIFYVLFSTLLTIVFGYFRFKYNYWQDQGVKQAKTHFLFGTISKLKSMHLSELFEDVYKQFKGKAKIAGTYLYTKPIAVVLDLELAKNILIKDFNKFVDRTDYDNLKHDPLEGNLFSLSGDKWRPMRAKLTPTFTSGKMKYMFPSIVQVANEFNAAFDRDLQASADNSIELHDILARFTTDVIGTCIFGLECNSLKDPDVEFRQIGRYLVARNDFSVRFRMLKLTYHNLFTSLGFKRHSNNVQNFIMRVVRETVAQREQNNIKRNDFINLLIELKNTKDEAGKPGLTITELAAQVFVFFLAGFETSSSNMSYGLYELAKNPHIQEKLRQEIVAVLAKHNDELSYEAMMEMKYLDQVITETLRKYPALSSLIRLAREDYNVPGTNITLVKNTKVHIPVKEIHYDPEYYDNPHEFRPERFNPEEVEKRHPQAFLGFGDGPRNCIGLRFGRMQVRVGLITLLKSYRFSVADKTQKPLKISSHSFIMVPKSGVWLKAEPL